MKARLQSLSDRILGNFWFVPSVLILSAAALGVMLPVLEERMEISIEDVRWLRSTPEGARTVLPAIAGAMITVAGVVFSVTMVTLSLASSQFGSRVLRNHVRDRATQVALGAFLGTSVYCLLVLRTVRATEELTFVPHLATTLGVVMAGASLFILIYFIQDVANAVQAPHIVARLAHDLNDSITTLFPERLGTGETPDSETEEMPLPSRDGDAWTVESTQEGYLQAIEPAELLALAKRHDLVVQLRVRPGAFITADEPVATVWGQADEPAGIAESINGTLIVGNARTPRQDVNCAIHDLAQLTLRALSPGINDPFTAINGIDRLAAAMRRLAQRKLPSRYRTDEDGRLRVIAERVTFGEALAAAFHQIRQHVAATPPVGVRLLEGLEGIARKARRESDLQAITQQAEMVLLVFQKANLLASDLRGIQHALERVKSAAEASRSRRRGDPESPRSKHQAGSGGPAGQGGESTGESPAEGEVNG